MILETDNNVRACSVGYVLETYGPLCTCAYRFHVVLSFEVFDFSNCLKAVRC